MGLKSVTIGSVIAALARTAAASQPGAAEPVPAPMRDLVWGKLNFLHTTDTHGWHGGHLQEPQYSADWGDYVSFAEHMRKRADEDGVDLLLVDTGDRVEGNGLYDASSPKGKYYYDIYREQDVDIICTGNHELYIASTADGEHLYTVSNFKQNYIASNLDYIDPKSGEIMPMAQRYRKFQTRNQKLDVVAFGFLFDFTGNANNTIVQPVRETVREEWFQNAIQEETDVFLRVLPVGLGGSSTFLNNAGKIMEIGPDDNRFMSIPEQLVIHESIVHEAPEFDINVDASQQKPLSESADRRPHLTEGYTTRDTIGTDGDDTLHKPVNFYVVPNCVQAEVGFPQEGEPEAVDLVFLDFITPWILMALRIVGGEYSEKDVQLYAEGTFTDMMAGWIEENWPKHSSSAAFHQFLLHLVQRRQLPHPPIPYIPRQGSTQPARQAAPPSQATRAPCPPSRAHTPTLRILLARRIPIIRRIHCHPQIHTSPTTDYSSIHLGPSQPPQKLLHPRAAPLLARGNTVLLLNRRPPPEAPRADDAHVAGFGFPEPEEHGSRFLGFAPLEKRRRGGGGPCLLQVVALWRELTR
ncbi:hypothetical protein CHGG_06375 [Chaetomium globosum CBS 148.51]|uniref:Uncharacterized protein n=1 Tax=Chaetomium globosum (strain ATCC 6205 / CBS 148.51 / DSM 1962 / NBRC 6347 / NRRL 1970) TaxID=306901 RepID=Q2H4P0_CHAGB|nr:uncharacterized protein CHGG_06375 [Chaetomium globosum CBS 148.51]EAQ89756.1 hypothetical protein CHGG_06375 [Chaetomium globosum CBS 148.51]